MSEQKVVEVRQTRSTEHHDDEREAIHWIKDDGLAGDLPRGILFTGVPMVGDKIVVRIGPGEPRRAEVTGYDLRVSARPKGWEDAPSFVLGRCSPVPDEDEALKQEFLRIMEAPASADIVADRLVAAVRKHMEANDD